MVGVCSRMRRIATGRSPLSFNADNLVKGVDDFDEVGLCSHDRVNGLIGCRRLVNDVGILAAFDAGRHTDVVFDSETALGFAAGHGSAGAVTAALEALGIAFATDDVGTGTHAAGNNAHVADLRAHRTFASNENVLAVVVLACDVVVMAVDGLHVGGKGSHFTGSADRFDDLAHHEIAIDAGEVLSPFDRFDVIAEMFGVLRKVCQILVGQILNEFLQVFPGKLDEVGAHAVADAAGTAVQEEPDGLGLVDTNLDEVVAGAQGAEVVRVIPAVELGMFFEDGLVTVFELGTPDLKIAVGDDVPSALVTLASVICSSVGHGFFDCGTDGVKIVRKVAGVEIGLDGHHAAADVDADGRGDNRAFGRDDAADRCADAPVNVGHGGYPLKDEGKLRDVEELLASLVLKRDALDPGLDQNAFGGFELDVVFLFGRHDRQRPGSEDGPSKTLTLTNLPHFAVRLRPCTSQTESTYPRAAERRVKPRALMRCIGQTVPLRGSFGQRTGVAYGDRPPHRGIVVAVLQRTFEASKPTGWTTQVFPAYLVGD